MGPKMRFKRMLRSKNLRANPTPSLLGITLCGSLLNRVGELTCSLGRYPERNELVLCRSNLRSLSDNSLHTEMPVEQLVNVGRVAANLAMGSRQRLFDR